MKGIAAKMFGSLLMAAALTGCVDASVPTRTVYVEAGRTVYVENGRTIVGDPLQSASVRRY